MSAAASATRSVSAASSVVLLPAAPRARIEAWARLALPEEACGFLLGRSDSLLHEIVDVRATENIAPDRRERFEIDGLALITIEQEARRAGLEFVGLWHSHPRGPATLSRADLDHAVAAWIQLVLAFDAHDRCELRAWSTATGRARELALESREPLAVA